MNHIYYLRSNPCLADRPEQVPPTALSLAHAAGFSSSTLLYLSTLGFPPIPELRLWLQVNCHSFPARLPPRCT